MAKAKMQREQHHIALGL